MSSSHDMDMKVIDRLRSFPTIVNDETESIGTFFLSNITRHVQQMSQQGFLIGSCIGQFGQSVADFGNEQNVRWRHRIDISKGQALTVFIHGIAGNFPRQDAIKNGRRSSACIGRLLRSADFVRK